MDLSILIVNWNTCDYLLACLRSIFAHPFSGKFEVIVVDNASRDESVARVRSEFSQVVLLAETENHGYAKGNNLAFAVASGAFCLTLNPDTEIPEASTLETAVAELKAREDCGVLSVRFIGPDEQVQHSIRGFPSIGNIFGAVTGLGDGYRMRKFDYSRSQYAPQPMGTFLLFRSLSLQDLGLEDNFDATQERRPFDESFPIFFNEVDLLARLKTRGWNCWYCAEVWIKHHGGMSTRQVRKDMIWESHRSLMRYLNKHTTGGTRLLLPLVNVLIWFGALVRARGVHAGFRP